MEPRRFRVESAGEVLAYGAQFAGGLLIVQDVKRNGWGRPHPVPSFEVFKRMKKAPEAVMVWIDEDSPV
jgi:hypothetical protein